MTAEIVIAPFHRNSSVCHFGTPAHDGQEILPVRLGLSRGEPQLACAGCRSHIAESTYLRVVERRAVEVPVAADRRRPLWLRVGRLARDFTGALR